jgi:hypothetical protein
VQTIQRDISLFLSHNLARSAQKDLMPEHALLMSIRHDKWFFLFAFAKNEKDNISKNDEKAFQAMARILFALDEKGLEKAVSDKRLLEVLQ